MPARTIDEPETVRAIRDWTAGSLMEKLIPVLAAQVK